jgi:hypothetical protein
MCGLQTRKCPETAFKEVNGLLVINRFRESTRRNFVDNGQLGSWDGTISDNGLRTNVPTKRDLHSNSQPISPSCAIAHKYALRRDGTAPDVCRPPVRKLQRKTSNGRVGRSEKLVAFRFCSLALCTRGFDDFFRTQACVMPGANACQ